MAGDPDAGVLQRFIHGDEAAFEQLFRGFQNDVFSWILRIVRDRGRAEDALVDAFWRAYRARAQFDPSRSFGAWMRRIATNAALDQLRSASRRRESPHADGVLPAQPPPDRETNSAIAAAFRRLPPELQIVAVLALVEEQPYAEIAAALDVPVGTVKSRVFRATRVLREELARLGVRPC
jgi:RNA polymerase sigma-70 factor (ECF subfamily)